MTEDLLSTWREAGRRGVSGWETLKQRLAGLNGIAADAVVSRALALVKG